MYTRGRRSDDDELPLRRVVLRGRGHRHRRGRPRRPRHLPRTRAACRLPDHAESDAIVGSCARSSRRSSRRFAARVSRRAAATPRPTGVWVGERKIASLGIHVSRRVTTHGFAVNVDNDLDAVRVDRAVRPATGVAMTSVARETGRAGRRSTASAGASRIEFAAGASGAASGSSRRARLDAAVGVARRRVEVRSMASDALALQPRRHGRPHGARRRATSARASASRRGSRCRRRAARATAS